MYILLLGLPEHADDMTAWLERLSCQEDTQ
jgi:hypothetical protein